MTATTRALALAAAASCLAGGARAQQALPFASGWELKGAARVESSGGRETLALESGFAYRRDVSLQDGTLDFDVQLTRRRSFVYVMFRMQDDREFEEIYLRPHKSGLPDALQYAPVWQGQSAWQLHHGPGGTAAVELEPGVVTHVRLVLQGRRAALFVGDMQKPALLVPRLAREPRAGYLALRGFLPAGVPGAGPIARYSNVEIRPGHVPFDFGPEVVAPAGPAGVVRSWAVSRAFAPPAPETAPSLPDAATAGEFRTLTTEPFGLLALHRHVPLPEGKRDAAALARVRVHAAQAGMRVFDLGFSDVATVFLNGRPLARLDQGYSYDAPRREGLIGYDQARLYLPLEQGESELAIVVADGFGGWGLMGRFLDPTGLRLEPR
jgi:hypothetical protein